MGCEQQGVDTSALHGGATERKRGAATGCEQRRVASVALHEGALEGSKELRRAVILALLHPPGQVPELRGTFLPLSARARCVCPPRRLQQNKYPHLCLRNSPPRDSSMGLLCPWRVILSRDAGGVERE